MTCDLGKRAINRVSLPLSFAPPLHYTFLCGSDVAFLADHFYKATRLAISMSLCNKSLTNDYKLS